MLPAAYDADESPCIGMILRYYQLSQDKRLNSYHNTDNIVTNDIKRYVCLVSCVQGSESKRENVMTGWADEKKMGQLIYSLS